jgi:hypothetical protein
MRIFADAKRRAKTRGPRVSFTTGKNPQVAESRIPSTLLRGTKIFAKICAGKKIFAAASRHGASCASPTAAGARRLHTKLGGVTVIFFLL